jgi:uncharacterized membrane protein YqiK
MDFLTSPLFWVIFGISLLFLFGFLSLVAKFYRKVNQGQALIINGTRGRQIVTFSGGVVWPIIDRAEIMDISVKTVDLERRGKDGLICKDNIRADIKVTFFVKVNKTEDAVLQVAQEVGCARASDQDTLEALFLAKFSEALKTVGKQLDFVELYEKRSTFRNQIMQVIGTDLNGYELADAAIDYLEQTPLEHLDKDNILDAEGIKKITQLTTVQNVFTNELRQEERKAIKKKDVEAQEVILALERQQTDAEVKQKREIATMRAREEAATLTVQAEEKMRAELARLKAEEEIMVQAQAKQRQVEVATKNRERVVLVETERVAKDQQLEAIGREREVEVTRIAKEKEIEIQKKEIADVIASRVAVDRTVAEEEERIKDVRAHKEAHRDKDVRVISAEADAQEKLVRDIKAAEAAEEVAKHRAKERLTLASAELEASDKEAAAQIRSAEGIQAQEAAEGLAKARVKEADAAATEKMGLAEAKVTREKMEAVAVGEEKQGLAKMRVAEAEASVIEKKGTAEATATRLSLLAQAEGDREKGLAVVRVDEAQAAVVEKRGLAEATAIEKKGLAEAEATKQKLLAEAIGLSEKAVAMKALDDSSRVHEEFRLRLQKEKEVELQQINIQKDVAVAQAEVLKQAFGAANIQIVGGDGEFFDRFIRALTLGKSVDGAVQNSEVLTQVLGDYLSGKASLPADLKEVLSRPAITGDTLQKLSLSALLARLAMGADGDLANKLGELAASAKKLGVDQVKVGA